jgi:excisionase family DNA binding protein
MSEPEHLSLEIPASTFDVLVGAAAARTLEHVEHKLEHEAWPEWLSVETAARYLDVSPERLRKLQARREIPYHQEAPGCRVLFRRRDLDEWMTGFRQPARQPKRGRHL